MAKNNNLKDFLMDLANEFRTYNTVFPPNRSINPQEFSSLVDKTCEYGFEKGYSEGIVTGTQQGYTSGYQEGKEAEYDRFWDSFQENGKRRNYWGAFCSWTAENFKPKYPIIATTAKSMFYLSKITEIDEIDLSGAALPLNNTFDYAGELVTIGKIVLPTKDTPISGGFYGCYKLVNITIEGNIGDSINFADSSLLSEKSIRNIIGCLSATATGKTLSISKTAKEREFTEEEWQTLIATKSNWTISLI